MRAPYGSSGAPELTGGHGERSLETTGRMVLVTVALGTMLAPLNSTMIVVALPDILREFQHSQAWGSWIVISYLVVMAAIQPLGGSLGDRYGRRRLFLIGLTGFRIAPVVAALAWRIEVVSVAHAAQAIAGATAIPNGTALVHPLMPANQQVRAFGFTGSGVAVAAGIGSSPTPVPPRAPV